MQGACYFALRQNGKGLKLHRNPAPAEQKRSQRQTLGTRPEPLHGGSSAAELEEACQHGTDETRIKGKAGGKEPAQCGDNAARVEKPQQNAEKHGKAADAQDCGDCLLHGVHQRDGGIDGVELLVLNLRAGVLSAEEDPGQKRGENVNTVEQQPQPDGAEYADAYRPDNKRGAGIVAEGQQTLRLLPGDATAFFHIGDIGRARGVAAREADRQRRGARAADAEKPGRKGSKRLPQQTRKPHAVQKPGEHEEGKERRDQQPEAHLQRLPAGRACDLRIFDERREQQQPQSNQHYPLASVS